MRTNNINFKGYNNVLCALDVPTPDGKRVSLITMRLNDEDGHKDLTELRKIRQMQGLPTGNENEDVLTLTYVDDIPKNKETFYFNDKFMYWGDELLQIEEKYIPKLISKENYQKEKNIHMKEYTLMANLTSRLMYEKFNGENEGVAHVISNLYNTICKILENSEQAFHLTNVACLKQTKFQDVALAFNRGIERTMEKFFKVH